jgi:hypothetical protein
MSLMGREWPKGKFKYHTSDISSKYHQIVMSLMGREWTDGELIAVVNKDL